MAFSESWVETDPDGAVITGSLLDDYQRQAKRAIRERLEGDPANMNSGIFESGTFGGTAIVRAGTARAYAVAAAGLGALTLQDGRIAITTDTNRLYHLKGSGMVEIGYAPIAGGAFNFSVAKLTSAATSTFGAALGAASFQLYADPVYGAVLAGFGTTSDVALAARDGSIILRSGPASVNIVTGGAMTVNGLLTVNSSVSITGGTIIVSGGVNPYINLNDGTAPSYIQIVGGAINLSSRTGSHTVSGSLSTSTTITIVGTGNLVLSDGIINTANGTPAGNHQFISSSGTTTGAVFMSLANSGNSTLIGMETSAGGVLFAGTSAYSLVFGTSSARSIHFVTGNAVRQTISGTGVVTFPSGVTFTTGDLTVADGFGLVVGATRRIAATSAGASITGTLTASSTIETTAGSTIVPNGQGFYARRNTSSAVILCMGYDAGTDDLSTRMGGTIWRVRDTGAGVMMSLTNGGLMTLLGGIITGGNVRIPHSSNYTARNTAGTGDINLIGTVAAVDWVVVGDGAGAQIIIGNSGTSKLGFYNSAPIAIQTVNGAKGGNVALANLMTALQSLGLLVDNTT